MVLTFKEGVRDRAILGIGLFSLAMIFVTFVFLGFFMRELDKVAVDINLSAISMAGLLLTFFISINLMAKDIDKHTIYCVLSKPFSRAQYVWGKYLGVMLIILTAFLILTVCSSMTIALAKFQYAGWFKSFSWAEYYKAIYALLLMFFVLNAVVIFFSSITSSSFITLLFSICVYIAGQTIEEAVVFLKSGQGADISISQTLYKLIDIVQYILPNLSVFDLKVQASHAIPLSFEYMSGITLYAGIYCGVLMLAASLIFNKRELS